MLSKIAITPDLNPSNMAKDITQGVQASVSKRTMELNCMLDVIKCLICSNTTSILFTGCENAGFKGD